MHSIRTKIIMLTVMAIVITMISVAVLGVVTVRNVGNDSADQILTLLCQSGEKNLNAYFDSIEQSVKTVSAYVTSDLNNRSPDQLGEHISEVERWFAQTANNTAGILTYYYRIDPAVSTEHKGFWYVRYGDNEFKPHEVTDITQYNTDDQSSIVWFSVPKATGESIWLPPYFTENLGAYVYSYNTPIFQGDRFIGVIGIEIDYHTIAQTVNTISLYTNGYAFINDDAGTIIYHPRMEFSELTGPNKTKTPDGLISDEPLVRYTYGGVEKEAAWARLNNGMRLNVTVPTAEINRYWRELLMEAIFVLVGLLAIFVFITWRLSRRITKPLVRLTEVAEQVDKGNYDVDLNYDGKDEVGVLTKTFRDLTGHLNTYITDLNNLVYSDALTSVHNKGAFDVFVRRLQTQMNEHDPELEFSIVIFDCDNLKHVNDTYGHQKGNVYLKTAASLICRVFHQSSVFRVGGDEFAAILMGEDYRERHELACLFEQKCAEIREVTTEEWEQANVSFGYSDYDPKTDAFVSDVVKRADTLMYQNKQNRKLR